MSKPGYHGGRFIGPITQLRFVQLVDGRKILQFAREGEYWQTPETVDVRSLDEAAKGEIIAALNVQHHENDDGR